MKKLHALGHFTLRIVVCFLAMIEPSFAQQRRPTPPPVSSSTEPRLSERILDGNVQVKGLADDKQWKERTQQFQVPLARLIGDPKPLMLRGASTQAGVSLPVPALWKLTQVTLDLRGMSSRALNDASHVAVMVNGLAVHQFSLKHDGHAFVEKVKIPVDLFKEGYNKVQLSVVQRSTSNCDDDNELWTQFDIERSLFTIYAEPADVPAQLDRLDTLFDKAIWQPRAVVPIMTSAAPSKVELSALGMLAQGVGQRYDYVPVSIRYNHFPSAPEDLAKQLPPESRGAILMGTYDEVAAYLQELNIPPQTGAVMAVRPLPTDSTRFVLILAARSYEQLANAATAFSLTSLPWPRQPWVGIDKLNLSESDIGQRRMNEPLQPDGAFPLRALSYKTTTYNSSKAVGTSLKFWNNSWQGRVQVRVHLSYVSGMGTQSAMNILTNGNMHGSIPLNNPLGGGYLNYAVTIPTGSLKPGWNTLEFRPALLPAKNAQTCERLYDEHLAVTLYEDTTVQKFKGNSLIQSDLALLSGHGSAYAENGTDQQIGLHLTDSSKATISSGLTLLAKLSQVNKGPLIRTWYGADEGSPSKNQVWVGPFERLSDDVKAALNMKLPERITVQIPLIASGTLPVIEGGEILSNLRETLLYTGLDKPQIVNATVEMTGQFTKRTFAYTTRRNDTTLTVFTADNSNALTDGINAVVEPGYWNQLRGSFAAWNPGETTVHVVGTEEAPFTSYGLRGGLGIWVSQYPWITLFTLLMVIGALVALTDRTLKLYRARQYRGKNG